MPVTPLHMGPALIAKAATNQHFSIPIFAFTQVAIDSEVLIGMAFVGDLSYHAVLHTFAGTTFVAILTLILLGPVIRPLMRLWNYISLAKDGSFTYMASDVPLRVVLWSALFGCYSHLFLDALGHPEIAPFAPLTDNNPFSGIVLPDELVVLCILSWIVGGVSILGLSYMRRRRAER